MTIELNTTKAALKAQKNQYSSLSEKLSAGENEKNSVTQQLDQATATLAAVEKRNILDEATDAELLEARKVVTDLTMQLEAVNRRIQLIREAIEEVETKIVAAARDFRNARMSFCFDNRDKALAKIKGKQQLKELLLTAMAANSSNGLVMHTHHVKTFVEQFILQILPEISEGEARVATEKFTKESGLEV